MKEKVGRMTPSEKKALYWKCRTHHRFMLLNKGCPDCDETRDVEALRSEVFELKARLASALRRNMDYLEQISALKRNST